MFEEPQSWITIAVVAAAALYLGRRAWRTIFGRGATHCGSGCGKCGEKPLVQLDAPEKSPISN